MEKNQPKRILMVDDDKIVHDLLATALKEAGFEVLEASDGEEGLEKIISEKPDLVLLDIIMPKMSGIQVLEKLKEKSILPGLSVIILTNLGEEIKQEKMLEFGIKDYIFKSGHDIIQIVEKVRAYFQNQDKS